MTAEHGTGASGGGGGLLRRISDNVSECTSEQEQSHGFFLSDSSAAETETGGGMLSPLSILLSYSHSLPSLPIPFFHPPHAIIHAL